MSAKELASTIFAFAIVISFSVWQGICQHSVLIGAATFLFICGTIYLMWLVADWLGWY